MKSQEETASAMTSPQVGDRFTEMYSFWLYVIGVEGETITTMEASGPCKFPKDGKVKTQTLKEFQKRLAYGSMPGYWVRLVDQGNDVAGWI